MNKKEIPMDFNEDFAIDIDREYNPEIATDKKFELIINDNRVCYVEVK